MTKPDDIPQDVWNEAYGQALLFVQWLVPTPTDYVQAEHVLAVTFARAIMAAKAEEREACANIADSKISGGYYDGSPVWPDGNEIASAIRKRGEAD